MLRTLIRGLAVPLLGVLLLAPTPAFPAADAPGLPEFRAGIASYRAGDYPAALAAFQAAQGAGLDSANLHVNLGLSYYKLGRYDESRAAFEGLRRFPGYHAIADYHLGLIAARQGEEERARELWRGAERAGAGTGAGDRASLALGRLAAGPAPRGMSGYVLAAAGYDSNPALLDEVAQAAAGGASSALELFGALDYALAQDAQRATVLRGGGYLRDYFDDNGLDQRGVFAGIGREWTGAARRQALSFDASASILDGERFLDTFGAGVESAPRRRGGLAARTQASRIEAAGPYRHLEGWRVRGELEVAANPGASRLRAGYQLEYNDREDFASGDEFYSHSPLRHRLGVTLDHPAAAPWLLRWSLRYRDSRFRDPNRFMDGGTLREERRVERLAQAGVQARRRLGLETHWLLEYQYSHNAATIDVFEYDRHVVTTGLEWVPRTK